MAKTAQQLYDRMCKEFKKSSYYYSDHSKSVSSQETLNADSSVQKDFVLLAFEKMCRMLITSKPGKKSKERKKPLSNNERLELYIIDQISTRLLRRKLPLNEDDYLYLADRVSELGNIGFFQNTQINALIGNLKKYLAREKKELWPELKKSLTKLLNSTAINKKQGAFLDEDDQKTVSKIKELAGIEQPLPLEPGEAWSETILSEIKKLPEQQSNSLRNLLAHCQTISSGKPTAKWIKKTNELIDNFGREEFQESITYWLSLIGKPSLDSKENSLPHSFLTTHTIHEDIIKGLVCCCSQFEDAEIVRALSGLTVSAYKKVPGVGPRAAKIGNACVWALGQISMEEALGQLAFLKVKIKSKSSQKEIEKAFNVTAERLGISRDEIEEIGAPTYGMSDVGVLEEQFGDFTARMTVTGTSTTQLVWIKPDGKQQKSIPASVKNEFADELKDLKNTIKDIQKMVPAQRERIDNLYLEQKTWNYPIWKQRYLDHPLVGTISRRLIWTFTTNKKSVAAIWLDGNFVDVNDNPVKPGKNSNIELWHPIGNSIEEITAWREWLEKHEVQQPFKQAHREVYLLTDAERNTNVYSNRFAAHIIKQHQFNALCSARGWNNKLRLMVDDEFPPAVKIIPRSNLRAEYWIEGIGEEYGTDTNEAGTFLYLSTDQVRFYNIDDTQRTSHAYGGGYRSYSDDSPIPLEELSPLVFSEVMRDVDLFVGVSSVANDPNWSDGGPEGRFVDYWQSYSFGELTETAKTRKEILQKLIPRLKIADQCCFEDKFLIVEGEIRNYKIHLGSSNIQMSPNNEYLCIVPGQGLTRKKTDGLFLPFEGDNMLSVILSKAFMLVEDKKITDQTIISQIGTKVRK